MEESVKRDNSCNLQGTRFIFYQLNCALDSVVDKAHRSVSSHEGFLTYNYILTEKQSN